MGIRKLVAAAFMAWVAVRAWADDAPASPPTDQAPKPTALTERVEKRLIQLDVAVEGDRDAIRGITAKDFVLYVGEHEISGLIVDQLCGDEPTPSGSPMQEEGSAVPRVAPQTTRPRATFTFFFDQPHLTTVGRARALETSRDLINRLVANGARASVVSNAERLETIVPLTEDREKLLAGLERLRNDSRQWDSYADTERSRAQEIIDVYGLTYMPRCPPLIAKAYAREEFLVARRSTERLAIATGSLAETPAPKALVYFGDSLRQSAGLHYLHIIPCKVHEVGSDEMVPSAAAAFDAVVNEALAHGVHFFTVQAEGLSVYTGDSLRPPRTAPGPNHQAFHTSTSRWNTERHRHAQDALVGLAAETGGEAFLGGASNKYIADRIESLSSCRLLLSFPPGDLPRDKAMGVTIKLHVPKVKIQTQGRIVVPSPASIERSRLLAAFVDPASSDDGSLRALLIPRGGDGKTWTAAVQVRLRPTGVPNNSAELGASVVRHDRVTDHFATSIATKSGSRPMVLERGFEIAPGEFSVIAVAREAKRGDVRSSRVVAAWPNPEKSPVAIAPIAALQIGPAAMSRDGAICSSGSLAFDVDETLDPSASVTLESVVCRGAKTNAPIVVERWLEDGLPNDFAPVTIADTEGPCVQTVDVVRAGRLRPGVVDYRVTARIGDEIVAQERRALRVGAAGEPR